MQEELEYLKILSDQLKACTDLHSRLAILDRDPCMVALLEKPSALRTMLAGLSPECALVIKSLVAMGQDHVLKHEDVLAPHDMARIRALLNDLLPVEAFYKDIGGIVGYHHALLSLLQQQEKQVRQDYQYHRPPGHDISSLNNEVMGYILEGISALEHMAELYAVGGAADRLHLVDPDTGLPLPAARLDFCGKTLLEGLIEDVQAREFLFYKLYGRQITLPIGMMTSQEKDNHRQILSICEQNAWFGRPKDSFYFFSQPAVPLVDEEGKWCQSPEGKLIMKPGGHGVIWKLAQDSGVFAAWKERGVKKILVRQINNPVAGCDYGLLAFMGIGWSENKAFGFASCPRQVEAAEGINVLLQKKQNGFDEYCLTNVEYCDFKKWGIEDKPASEGCDYSLFPSNTNVLFVDLQSIEAAIERCPIPGTIVNVKKIALLDNRQAARLESTMQNIADCLVDRCDPSATQQPNLKTFLTYHVRRKTISTTKRAFSGGSFLETPDGCFYDILQNARDLLVNFCGYEVPVLDSCESTLKAGPAFLFFYHPGLGPLYSIIGQKLRKGRIALHSELDLQIAEIESEDLFLQGSLKIHADNILGGRSEGQMRYGNGTGKCLLKRVKIVNRGIDRDAKQCYWKKEFKRHELCEIVIHGNGEFIAENVVLNGDMQIEVEDGVRCIAVQKEGELYLLKEEIQTPLSAWKYCIKENSISLEK